jgi:hypothetical protein
MIRREKYDAVKDMGSIEQLTTGEYPSFSDFKKALSEGRLSGYYTKRIVIVSNDPRKSYTFVNN